MNTAPQLFLALSTAKLRSNMALIRRCLEGMDSQSVWARPNSASNSAANLCLHLAGNLGQLIGHAVAGGPDTRSREAEFSASSGPDAAQLCSILRDAVDSAAAIIAGLPTDRLNDSVEFRGRQWTRLEIIYQAVEHFALHTGQIVYIAKSTDTIPLS
ncbi:MAG: hypothetical protein C0504_00170 [Candidatus Solibacter sp.]|nr:hypothetical protein [Candidatus Solibacter sp.]